MILNAETRTKNYLKFLGWQGGTIHQIAQEFNCEVDIYYYMVLLNTHILVLIIIKECMQQHVD